MNFFKSRGVALVSRSVVESFMHAGLGLATVDKLRTLLERGGRSLTSRQNLGQFVPKIEDAELQKLLLEMLEDSGGDDSDYEGFDEDYGEDFDEYYGESFDEDFDEDMPLDVLLARLEDENRKLRKCAMRTLCALTRLMTRSYCSLFDSRSLRSRLLRSPGGTSACAVCVVRVKHLALCMRFHIVLERRGLCAGRGGMRADAVE